MYWKEIPVQVEFTQNKLKKTAQFDEKFQIAVDSIAMKDGSYGSDAYLDSWQWVTKSPVDSNLDDKFIQDYVSSYVYPKDFIKKLRKSNFKVNENSLSTHIYGDYDELTKFLIPLIKNNFKDQKNVVLQMKIFKGDRSNYSPSF